MVVFALMLAPLAAVAGMYQAHQMELAAALDLQPDGHFLYQLEYGAVAEQVLGDWTFDGKIVRLTSRPTPQPPSFELVRDDPTVAGDLVMTVEPPGFGEGYSLEALAIEAASGRKFRVRVDDQGRVDSGGRAISAIEPIVPIYGMIAGHFELSPGRGHRLLLRFHPNDLGKASFSAEPLALTDGKLVLIRYNREIRFIRVRP